MSPLGRRRKSKANESVEDPMETSVDPSTEPKSTKKSSTKRRAKAVEASSSSSAPPKRLKEAVKPSNQESECSVVGDPIPLAESRSQWPKRYKDIYGSLVKTKAVKGTNDDESPLLFAECHYNQAQVDGCIYNLGDDIYVKADDDKKDFIAKIVEIFKATDGKEMFTAQWYFRAEDTVIREIHASLVDEKRVFISDYKNDNPLNSILSKIKIVYVSPNVGAGAKEKSTKKADYYYDMQYSVPYSTFLHIPRECTGLGSEASSSSTISSDGSSNGITSGLKLRVEKDCLSGDLEDTKMRLLDLYSGCGAMSTGLCSGAKASGVNLVTSWAVDFNEDACKSLKLNHPKAEVRHEKAEDFLSLLKEWRMLCEKYGLLGTERAVTGSSTDSEEVEGKDDLIASSEEEEEEVEKLVAICVGDPHKKTKTALHYKVRWKGYSSAHDTWEPPSNLTNCEEVIKDFVTKGYKNRILPLPGDVDVICGGPPCQGISGYNRFRDKNKPLDDPKNSQLIVFMNIVEFLKPRFVLMENVVDILKFAQGYLGRYAIARLVSLNYQTRVGIMAAGCYGLAQFRMRAFFWGARTTEKLPPFPLPTHETVVRGFAPKEFDESVVGYEEGHKLNLPTALTLCDCISDLPPVKNDENRDEMAYSKTPQNEFQRFIRASKNVLMGMDASSKEPKSNAKLFDHRPLCLNKDDYTRVCLIPKKKGANFRDLPGVLVLEDNKVMRDPKLGDNLLPSGKPLVPKYTITWKEGYATECFGRVWWDEIVPTVVTRAQPHNRAIVHPEQDRVLTIRENARLQGFPDFYKLVGNVKQRYMQVGNAVAVPVARSLGYALGLASQGKCDEKALITLPPKFNGVSDEE